MVLVIAGIHSGEIAGKDAIRLLLRDIARGQGAGDRQPPAAGDRADLQSRRPRERAGPYNRFVQWGPEGGTGTRRNAQWLDLNRDFAKLESPECRALVRLGAQFDPHIFVDLHTNDGYEHQYDDALRRERPIRRCPARRRALVDRLISCPDHGSMKADGFASFFGYPVDELDLTSGIGGHAACRRT